MISKSINIRRAGLTLVCALSIGFPARAEESVSPGEAHQLSEARNYRPLDTLKIATLDFFDTQNQITAGVVSGVLLYSFTLDERARTSFRYQHRLFGFEHVGNEYLGTGLPGVVLGASFWFVGQTASSAKTIHSGQAQLEAVLVTAIATTVLKYGVARERPNRDPYSFPSGHTSTVMTTAMVMQDFYGWKVGTPFFLLGVATAVGRLNDDRHWLSDTVAGAGLGMLVGHAVARAHLRLLEDSAQLKPNATQWQLSPLLLNDGAGIALHISTP